MNDHSVKKPHLTISEIVRKSRSYRRFHQEPSVTGETLRELIGLTRFCPSAANLQPLKYVLSSDRNTNARIFPHLAWAAYLRDWDGPKADERPTGYIIVLQDTKISKSVDCDHGIVCQTILLGAAEQGLGGCILGAVDRKALRKSMGIPGHLDILLVIAMGTPRETVVIESVPTNGDVRYWRDNKDVHHVPKRPLQDLILT
jgi:nitroreductase